LSNWTELDVWQYILRERIEIVPLYFAAERPTVERDGLILMIDDDRFPLDGEAPRLRKVRFRTLGCYPLSGAILSEAASVEAIIAEMLVSTSSEREGRAIDRDGGSASMEKKKQEGYF
jgi:sulfate adenylyltransferase subunit 2